MGALVYFGYVLMGTAVYAGVMGMVGVVGAWWFVGRIYGAIKAD